jgi:hypothetical protein
LISTINRPPFNGIGKVGVRGFLQHFRTGNRSIHRCENHRGEIGKPLFGIFIA